MKGNQAKEAFKEIKGFYGKHVPTKKVGLLNPESSGNNAQRVG